MRAIITNAYTVRLYGRYQKELVDYCTGRLNEMYRQQYDHLFMNHYSGDQANCTANNWLGPPYISLLIRYGNFSEICPLEEENVKSVCMASGRITDANELVSVKYTLCPMLILAIIHNPERNYLPKNWPNLITQQSTLHAIRACITNYMLEAASTSTLSRKRKMADETVDTLMKKINSIISSAMVHNPDGTVIMSQHIAKKLSMYCVTRAVCAQILLYQ